MSDIDEKKSTPSDQVSFSNEVHRVEVFKAKEVDAAAVLVAGDFGEFDPAKALRIRIQFMDKTTLGSSAILGIREATHLTTNQ
ncbi:membrane transporter [Moniliophthora roreri]|nr:membrane transporter [Moniliophthora roreri]